MRYWPLNRVGWLSAHHDVFRDSADSRAHTNDGARGLVPVSDV